MNSWGRTFLPPLLARVVDVVLQLDADLPLVRLVSDERVLQELIGGRPLGVILHQTVLNKVDELLGPDECKTKFRLNIKVYQKIKGGTSFQDVFVRQPSRRF